MHDFMYTAHPARVIFGVGKVAALQQEVAGQDWQRVFVLCAPNQRAQAEAVCAPLGAWVVGAYDQAQMHVPVEVARQACTQALQCRADCLVAVGGGSTTGLAKAIARQTGLPILAIPTTYAGSEMTPIYGLTENGLKKTGKDARVLPKVVIYDPELTRHLPLDLAIASGLNAIAHAAEGLYARDANPIMTLMAEEGIRALVNGLRGLRQANPEGYSDSLYGAWLCGMVLGNVGMALHHKLCHVLGGSFNLPHAQTHAIILPHAIAYNAQAARPQLAGLARTLHCDPDTLGTALYDLARELGAPLALCDVGMREADLDRAAHIALSDPYWNPRPLESSAIRGLLQSAFVGVRPG